MLSRACGVLKQKEANGFTRKRKHLKVKVKRDFYAAVPEPLNHNGHLSPLKDMQLCVFFKLKDYGMILLPDKEELPLRWYFPSQW